MTTERSAFKVVACAIDRSAGSRSALRTAAALARQLDATLVLLHVDPVEPGEALFAPPAAQRRARPIELQRWMQEAFELRGAPVEMERASGRVAPGLLGLLRRRNADLLVMGTGATRPVSLALGSVAGALVAAAPCPVLVVGPPPRADIGRLTGFGVEAGHLP